MKVYCQKNVKKKGAENLAYVDVPKDVIKIREKYILGLSKREVISVFIGGAIGLAIYFKLRQFIGISAMYVMIVFIIPILFIGFYDDDGITFEKKLLYILKFLFSNQVKVYKCNNFYKKIDNQILINEKIQEVRCDKKSDF